MICAIEDKYEIMLRLYRRRIVTPNGYFAFLRKRNIIATLPNAAYVVFYASGKSVEKRYIKYRFRIDVTNDGIKFVKLRRKTIFH